MRVNGASDPFQPSRRATVAAAGSVLLAALLPRRAGAEVRAAGADAPPGFLPLRAHPGSAPLRGTGPAETPIWGYEGQAPGPLLRVKRGQTVSVRLVNALAEPTAIHWHGVRLANAMDGAPHLTQAPTEAGARFDYRFAPPDAGTFWYHAPLALPEQRRRGLYGALIVDEEQPPDIDRDVLLVLDAWPLDREGRIAAGGADASRRSGLPGHLTANGRPILDIAVRSHERLRLRLINAAPQLLALRIERHRAIVAAIDGQPAEPYPARDGRVIVGPGNRMDLFVDADLAPGARAAVILETPGGESAVAQFVYAADAPARPAPRATPPGLAANPLLPERMDFVHALKRELSLAQASGPGALNDTSPDRLPAARPDAPLFAVKRGRTVMLGVSNPTAVPHALHLHGHHFRLLDRLDDGWKPFWLDTLVVLPGRTERIAFVADNPGKWLIESNAADETALSRTAWFDVI